MNGPLRSKQGCWTCRLRRKKCDERHPTCITCDSLEITCYGYGTKPDFMDGGDKEREVKSRIRDIVKTTSRKKGRLGISIRKFGTRRGASHDVETGHVEKTGQLKIAPKDDKAGTDVSSPASSSEPHRSDSASQSHGTSNTSHSPRSESLQDNRQASSVPPIPTNEAVLLMHFLDNVFPIQYPMYKPTVVEGGRGWFLSLLLRTKPLYHAALALSSFHTGTAIYGAAQIRAGENWRGCPEEEKHIQIALIAFREELENIGTWMQTRCPRDSLGFLGCTIQLIYFELFARRGDSWQIHLMAGTSMFLQAYSREVATHGLTENLQPLVPKAAPYDEPLESEDIITFKFLCGILIWLDVLASITTGKTPRLLPLHDVAILPDSPLRLEKIIGCSNWAVVQIGRIAALHEYKIRGLADGTITPQDLLDKATEIRVAIDERSTSDCMAALGLTQVYVPAVYNPLLVTRLFARTAQAYLQIVMWGYKPDSQCLAETVRDTMYIFREHVPRELMPALIFPLYIFGCVARKEDEDFFRDILSTAPVLDPAMEHRAQLLPIMEAVWARREERVDGWSWQDLLLSGNNLLLV